MSLSQTAQQFGVLIDELVNRREKWRRRRQALSLQEIDELPYGFLFLRRK